MVYTIKLTNSILGWMLVPSYKYPAGNEEILNQLYGEDWLKMKPFDRAFMKNEPVEKAIQHIKEVCADMGIGVSFCGNRKVPTVRLWWNPVKPTPIETISVDLKWSCWLNDRGVWDEYSAGTWERMQAAFEGTAAPITINTAPRKECRYGSITISKGKASGYFATEWDEVSDLADTLNTEPTDAFCDSIPFSIHLMEAGMDWEFTVKARKFHKLMEKLDNEENNLLQTDRKEWSYLEQLYQNR